MFIGASSPFFPVNGMQVKHVPSIKKKPIVDAHGESCMYQIWWQDDSSGELFGAVKPDGMVAFEHFARLTLEPGDTNMMHTHVGVEQVYMVVRGGGTIQVGEERREVGAGDVVFLPSDVPHGFFNTGEKRAILLLVGTKIK